MCWNGNGVKNFVVGNAQELEGTKFFFRRSRILHTAHALFRFRARVKLVTGAKKCVQLVAIYAHAGVVVESADFFCDAHIFKSWEG